MFVNVAHAVIDIVPEQDKMNIYFYCDFVHAQRNPQTITFLMANFQTIFFGGENSISHQRQTFITMGAPERNVSVRCAKTAEQKLMCLSRTFFTVPLYAITHDTTEVQKDWLLHFPHGRKTKHATYTDKFSLVGNSTTP